MKRLAAIISVLVVIGIATYLSAYFLTLNSDGFEFASQQVRRSRSVVTVVGPVTEIKLPLNGTFEEKFSGDRRILSLELQASGTKGSATVLVLAERQRGQWKMMELHVNGQPVSLD